MRQKEPMVVENDTVRVEVLAKDYVELRQFVEEAAARIGAQRGDVYGAMMAVREKLATSDRLGSDQEPVLGTAEMWELIRELEIHEKRREELKREEEWAKKALRVVSEVFVARPGGQEPWGGRLTEPAAGLGHDAGANDGA